MRESIVIHFVAAAVITAVMMGCATDRSRHGKPEWVEGSSAQYPDDRFLRGIGQGQSRETAERRAYAALAKVFRTTVIVRDRDRESYAARDDETGVMTNRRMNLETLVEVSSDKVLENVRIAHVWREPSQNTYYALAVMDRTAARQSLAQRIHQVDATIESDVRRARNPSPGDTTLFRVKLLRRAIANLHARKSYDVDLRVLTPAGVGMDAPYSIEELKAELNQLLGEHLVVAVEVMGDEAESVRLAVIEGLVREGLPVLSDRVPAALSRRSEESGDRATPDLLVRGTVGIWHAQIPDPLFTFVRWCADFVVIQTGDRRIIGAVSRHGKEGHLTLEEAKLRALREMQPMIIAALSKTLAGYIFEEREAGSTEPTAASCLDRKTPNGRVEGELAQPLLY